MSSRVRILANLRRRLEEGRPAAERAEGVAARLRLAGAQTAPRPAASQLEGAEALARFEEKLRAVDASVSHVASFEALPEALASELRARNLPAAIRMGEDAELTGLDWSGLEASRGPGRIEEPATLSRAVCGAAETGTVALRSGPENPVTLTFLGETHFIVLRRSEVVPGLEELWARVRRSGAQPRTVNLVTGPSRSADIGGVLQLGAHGPVAVHVFLVDA
ncbi:LUD domain-containing protein [Albimonas sp. CAU 1670]|uniref:LutC/YkgG family protein n=1 Tax=Albimonas sp. CAU 1670 TaxID=3032599 RepID=UPI0023DB0955|nr:LUD domain-containing protein [Albimonas sp. CAU 1670]MDF2232980.1 LUD domain-containing protein [Albimonas sp. CAU 1670]